MRFYEAFHDATPALKSQCDFIQQEIQNDKYMSLLLQEGLPNYFDFTQPESQGRVSTGGRASLQQSTEKLLEIQMFTDLRAFFREKSFDVGEIVDVIKVSKRSEDPKVWV